MTISFRTDSKEIKSIIEQIEKQQITVGNFLQNLILTKRKEEGKEPKNIRDYMESQRSYCWEQWRASNLIQSYLLGIPVPEITVYRADDKSQFRKVLDGQQRLTSTYLFINNMLNLDLSKSIFPTFEIEGQQYTYSDFQGKTFSELPELLKDVIMNYDLRLTTINNCDEDQAEKFYVSMNAGMKSLKPAEVRTAAMGISTRKFFSEILKSDWVFHTMTPKAATTNSGQEIISQVITLLNNSSPVELSKENIDKTIYSFRNGVPENLKYDLISICNYLNEVTNIWIENKKRADEAQTVKKGKKVSNYAMYRFPFFKKVSIVMLMMAADKAAKNNVPVTEFAKWAFDFFKEPNREYSQGLGDKTNELLKVEYRLNAINDEIEKLEKYNVEQNQSEIEIQVEQDDQPELDSYDQDQQDDQKQEQILTQVHNQSEDEEAV